MVSLKESGIPFAKNGWGKEDLKESSGPFSTFHYPCIESKSQPSFFFFFPAIISLFSFSYSKISEKIVATLCTALSKWFYLLSPNLKRVTSLTKCLEVS